MRPLAVVAVLCAFVLVGSFAYRKGVSDANKKAEAERQAEYGNDWNSDPDVKHSTAYSMGYARGHGMGEAETDQRDFLKCSEKLAYLAVESGNARVAGKYLVEGEFAPSQLKAAETKFNQTHR